MPIEEADLLFGRLNHERVESNRKNGESGYDKTAFIIYYQIDGERSTYEGRQEGEPSKTYGSIFKILSGNGNRSRDSGWDGAGRGHFSKRRL